MKREDLLKKYDARQNVAGSMSRVDRGDVVGGSNGNRDSILSKSDCRMNKDGSMSKVPAMSAEASSGQEDSPSPNTAKRKNGAGTTV